MARYTSDSRERVRERVDFVELVGARTELRKAGQRRYVGRCPFHEERTPSFGIDPVDKLYHCFGCGVGGDVFSFVMETENVDFVQALEMLADRVGLELERETEDPRAAERRARRDRLVALLERTAAYYVRVLWQSPEAAHARAHLAERGLDEAVLREFRVGYAPDAWERVVAGSQHAGYSAAEVIAAGLAQRSRDGRPVDRFRGRLMFPLADLRGRVLGFGARALAEGQQPKYVNSSEGELYSKGEHLFATHLARADAARAGSVVLVEGYTDVIALHQAGIRNVVGSMGTALTERQAGVLLSLAPHVVLCLDADTAGQDATVRAEAAVRAAGREHGRRVDVRVVVLPAGRDPADVVAAEGAEATRSLLEAAVPFARFQVERALERGDTSTAEGRDAVLAEVTGIIRGLPPSVLREEMVQVVAGRLALSEGLVAAALGDGGAARVALAAPDRGGAPNGNGNGHAGAARHTLDHREDAERSFLALCIALPQEGARRLAAADLDALFTTPVVRRAALHLREHASAPASHLPGDDTDLARLIAELVLRARESEDAQPAQLERAELHLELTRLDRAIAAARLEAGPVSDLAAERQRVLGELRRLTA